MVHERGRTAVPAAGIAVRRAVAGDAPAIIAISNEVHAMHASALPDVFQPPNDSVLTPEDVELRLDDPSRTMLVATAGDLVLGYLEAQEQATLPTPIKRGSIELHVHQLAVAAVHRGRGAGRILLQAARDVAASRGISTLSLTVYAFNALAKKFYEREGFVTLRESMVSRTKRS